MTASATNRRPSAIDALGEALSHTRAKLFPFSFGGWLTLAFVTFFESCGSGGGGGGSVRDRVSGPGSFDDPARILDTVFGWIAAHMIIFVTGLIALMIVSLLFMWIRARMIFVYADDVATGRFDLVRPWNDHGGLADSFFGLSLLVQGASFIAIVLVVGLGGLFLVWARASEWAVIAVVMGMLPLIFVFVIALLVAAVLNLVLRDFVAPLQLTRGIGSQAAVSVFLSLLGAHTGTFVGYAVLKFILNIVIGIVMVAVTCLTCCVGALPIVHQMLFQPVYYAERAWSLKLLAQMGEDITGHLMPAPPVPEPEAAVITTPDDTPATIRMSAPPVDPDFPHGT